LAARTSLQKPQDNQILTPLDIYSWLKENFKSIHLKYIQFSEVEDTRVNLQTEFDVVQPVPGTCNYHAFIPIIETCLVVKKHSWILSGQTVNISTLKLL
jgi:hypothetical protein